MNRLAKSLSVALVLLALVFLAAGCGQGGKIKSAVSSAAASNGVTISPPTFSPRTREPTSAATPEPATTGPAPAPSSEAPPESAAGPSQSAAATGSGSSLLWLWILLGVVAAGAIIGIVAAARRSGRRAASESDWRARAIEAYAKGSALYDTMTIAAAPGALAPGDPSGRWADIQRRADDLSQALYALRETAPSEAERARAVEVLACLQTVRSAMDAARAPGGDTAEQRARVHGLLQSFGASLRGLRPAGNDTRGE